MDADGQGFQVPNGSDVLNSNPRYAQEYAQQLAEARQAAAEEQHERLYGPALRSFWESPGQEVEQLAPHDLGQFKNHQLPLARIKKIMKSDEDVRMISAEAPVLFAKACELFILELTLRSWVHAEEGRRRTLQRSDVAAAISKDEAFDFLADIVPQEDTDASAAGDGQADAAAAAGAVPSLPAPPGAYGGGGGYGAGGQQQQQQQQQWSSDPSGQQSGEASGL